MKKVWAGPLSRRRVVIVLWNRSGLEAPITVGWREIGLSPSQAVIVRDVWKVIPKRFSWTKTFWICNSYSSSVKFKAYSETLSFMAAFICLEEHEVPFDCTCCSSCLQDVCVHPRLMQGAVGERTQCINSSKEV